MSEVVKDFGSHMKPLVACEASGRGDGKVCTCLDLLLHMAGATCCTNCRGQWAPYSTHLPHGRTTMLEGIVRVTDNFVPSKPKHRFTCTKLTPDTSIRTIYASVQAGASACTQAVEIVMVTNQPCIPAITFMSPACCLVTHTHTHTVCYTSTVLHTHRCWCTRACWTPWTVTRTWWRQRWHTRWRMHWHSTRCVVQVLYPTSVIL